ncbi:NUDIX domain-containing protein [Candidatus Kaiserbacteria bacterium]|nr:NUDIX domain-containing protein [Candidatus Kaiserbacteria bacterium]
MKKKREVAGYVPYRKTKGRLEFFLQMRDIHAKTNPNMLGVFGGGIEDGETIEQCLYREILEELEYRPQKVLFFSRYEHALRINNLFIEEVGTDFENKVTIHEGQYGKFLTNDEVRNSEHVTPMVRIIVNQLSEYLAQ